MWGCSKSLDKEHSILFLFYPITLEGRRGTTDEFTPIPFYLVLFSAALVEPAKSIPVQSLILSSHLFFCLPLFLFPFTVPCMIVFAKPEDHETWPNYLSFRFLTGSGVRHIFQWLLDLSANLLIGNITGWKRTGHMLCIVVTSLSVLMTLSMCLCELCCLLTVWI